VKRRLSVEIERWPLARPLVTADTAADSVELLVARIEQDGRVGRGEAAGVYYHQETAPSMRALLEEVRSEIEGGADRSDLAELLPAGGARNALDCALWELEARLAGRSVAELLAIEPAPLRTVTTLSLASAREMAEQAAGLTQFGTLKVKLDADDPVARVAAIREARPEARLIVDANSSWTPRQLRDYAPPLAALGVEMIEQPCQAGADETWRCEEIPLPICADESCHTAADLPRILVGYRMVCIKLDKAGGLTAALELAHAARAAGLGLMIGNMLGTSLAMAPLSLLGPMCRYVDIDGPLLLRTDRAPGMRVDGDVVQPMVPEVWG
jgi:L-alanine-DL-glutamate epimerase-like enolase superfamily enzyme